MGMFLRRGPAPHITRMSVLEIGQTIKLNLNGTPWDWLIVHQGLPSSIYDASCDGTWLLLKNIYDKRQWNSFNANKLESSEIHSYLNGDFQNLFDSNIKRAIKQVKIPYRKNGGSGGTDQSGANGLPCKVFLLSGPEVGLGDLTYMPNDGDKLAYFENGAATSAKNKRIAYRNGSAASWWLRSPRTSNTGNVWYVNPDGNYGNSDAANLFGIRPALVLPPDALVDDEFNLIA